MSGSCNCPRHGTHGATSHGECWYCAIEGRAEETQKQADESAKEEKNDDQVSTDTASAA